MSHHIADGLISSLGDWSPLPEFTLHPAQERSVESDGVDTPVVRGHVTPGDQRGRELGFPTANLVLEDINDAQMQAEGLIDGVWAGRCVLPDGRSIAAAISIGRRGTFYGGTGVRLLEAHLLDFCDDLYGSEISVYLHHWIRGQTTFATKEELIAALEDDVLRTRVQLRLSS